MAKPSAHPICQVLLTCDQAWRDPTTGKVFLLGLFRNITCASFPTTYPQLTVFAILLEGPSRCDLSLQLTDLRDGSIVHDLKLEGVSFPNPLGGIELLLNLRGVEFPHAGAYEFVLTHQGERLQGYRIDVGGRTEGTK